MSTFNPLHLGWSVGGHLGTRVSALLDGQLSTEEEERAWDHVHTCHQCRDLVEREGWVKTRLAGLSWGSEVSCPDRLRGSLLSGAVDGGAACLGPGLDGRVEHRGRRVGLVALGSGAAGAAVMGVLALGTAPADIPHQERRAPSTPTTSLNGPAGPAAVPSRRELVGP